MARINKKVTTKDEITIGAKEEVTIINPGLQKTLTNLKERGVTVENTKEEVGTNPTEKKEEEVTLVAPTVPTITPVKMVKVKLNCNHRCYIGGEWYTFNANTQYNVPEQVKTILMGANLLQPL